MLPNEPIAVNVELMDNDDGSTAIALGAKMYFTKVKDYAKMNTHKQVRFKILDFD